MTNNNGPTMTFHLGVRDATSKFIDLPPHLHDPCQPPRHTKNGTKRKSATRPCYVSSRFGVSKWDET